MFTSILVPLDESSLSRSVLPYVEHLARPGHARVTFVHVIPHHSIVRHGQPDDDAVVEASELAASLQQAGVDASATEAHGRLGPAIVQTAADVGADLIAMSTHGRGELGRVLHGSVAEEVLRGCHVPLLLATPNCTRRWVAERALRVLVPLDGSPLAKEALAAAVELARSLDVELRLVRAIPEHWELDALGFGHRAPAPARDRDDAREYLEQVAAQLRQDGRSVLAYVEEGDPASWIARVIDDDAIDLVVMATHGRGSLNDVVLEGIATVVTGGRLHFALGSVAAAVVQHASAPVLLVRPAEPTSE